MTTKARVRAWLEQRFFLRIHMTLILAGTFLAGVVTTRLLMQQGVNTLALRYAVAVSFAYLVFLALVKLWLLYVGSESTAPGDLAYDALDAAGDGLARPAMRVASVRSSGGGSGGDTSSMLLDVGGGDLDDLVFVIVLIAIVLLLGGIAIYFIYTAPALLSEAAFEAVLAASIARRAKSAEGSGWLRPVMRATMLPFLGVLVLSLALGWIAQKRCPDALRLRDAIHCPKG